MVGDGSRCLWGYNSYPFRLKRERAHPFVTALLQAFLRVESSCVPFFYFYSESGKEQGAIMAGIRMSDSAALKMVQEFDLLLEELETMLENELIAIHLVRKEKRYDPAMILDTAVRLLSGKKKRTIKEDAILAYAEFQLRKLEEERN
jgi:hypothetical protein